MSLDGPLVGPPLVTCPHCGMTVPAGNFCGHCGAHLPSASTTRRHAFAAVPAERVARLSIVSTLFPHLPHRRGGAFRWALLAGSTAVVILAALHLFAPATIFAVFMLPVLYLLYLYEVEVYESEPWLLIGATMVAGAVAIVVICAGVTNLRMPAALSYSINLSLTGSGAPRATRV